MATSMEDVIAIRALESQNRNLITRIIELETLIRRALYAENDDRQLQQFDQTINCIDGTDEYAPSLSLSVCQIVEVVDLDDGDEENIGTGDPIIIPCRQALTDNDVKPFGITIGDLAAGRVDVQKSGTAVLKFDTDESPVAYEDVAAGDKVYPTTNTDSDYAGYGIVAEGGMAGFIGQVISKFQNEEETVEYLVVELTKKARDFKWVKLVSKDNGTYTVIESNEDCSQTYGDNISGVKIANPGGGTPSPIPSTKAYPAYYNREGNLVFFFNNVPRSTFVGYHGSVEAANPNTHFNDSVFGDLSTRITYLKFTTPLIITASLGAPVLLNTKGLRLLHGTTLVSYTSSSDAAVYGRIILYAAAVTTDFDVTTVTWNTKPTTANETEIHNLQVSATNSNGATLSLVIPDVLGDDEPNNPSIQTTSNTTVYGLAFYLGEAHGANMAVSAGPGCSLGSISFTGTGRAEGFAVSDI